MSEHLPAPTDDDGQPWLLPDLPADPALLRERVDVHTGARILEQMDEATAIVSHSLAHGKRAAARAYRISRNSVSALVQWFADHGKLEPLRDKLAGRLEVAAWDLTLALQRDIELDRLKPEAKAFTLGVILDNAARLRTAAGPAPEACGAEGIEAWVAKFKAAKPALDVESEVRPIKPQETAADRRPDTADDTAALAAGHDHPLQPPAAPEPTSAPAAPVALVAPEPEPEPARERANAGAGGGARECGGGQNTTGLPPQL